MRINPLNKLLVLIIVLVIAVFVRTTAFAGNKTTGADNVDHSASKVDNYLSDTTITAKVKAKILEDKRFSISSLSVVTDHGKVTVSGFVTSVKEVRLIRRTVLNTHGVKSFTDQLRVRHSSPSSLRLYASDVATTSEALTRLFTASNIDAQRIHVTTRHSEVFLTGTVTSKQQKQQAQTVVSAISGVHRVKNELLIQPQHDTAAHKQQVER